MRTETAPRGQKSKGNLKNSDFSYELLKAEYSANYKESSEYYLGDSVEPNLQSRTTTWCTYTLYNHVNVFYAHDK